MLSLLIRRTLLIALSGSAFACAADDATDTRDPNATQGDASSVVGATADSGTPPPLDAGSAPVSATADSGSTTRDAAVSAIDGGAPARSDGGSTVTSDASVGMGSDAGEAGGGGQTSLTGTYGALGPVKPVVSSLYISTGLETILYLSSAPLTCAVVMTEGGRWLLMLPSDTQVLEIVVRGAAKVGTVKISPAEANYAQGGKSSATETVASSGSLTFTKVEAKSMIEGTLTASYASLLGGSGSVMGSFHADFCEGGQEW